MSAASDISNVKTTGGLLAESFPYKFNFFSAPDNPPRTKTQFVGDTCSIYASGCKVFVNMTLMQDCYDLHLFLRVFLKAATL